MKRTFKSFTRSISFISKSLLWSVLFYLAFMTVINWDEIINTRKATLGAPELVRKSYLIPSRSVSTNAQAIPVHIQSDNRLSYYADVTGNKNPYNW
jgi:hypothetical protein